MNALLWTLAAISFHGRLHCVSTASNTTQEQRDYTIQLHDEKRLGEGATNMNSIEWNEEIATLAQKASDTCVMVHKYMPSGWGGQSMAPASKDAGYNEAMKQAVDTWFNEKNDYTYETAKCAPGKGCIHYEIMVKGDLKYIGCAAKDCETWYLVTCNYQYTGALTFDKLYQKGDACSNCSSPQKWCRDELCDLQCARGEPGCECKADCKNGGSLNEADCSCTCVDGWVGTDCSQCPVCSNEWSNCDANPTWCGGGSLWDEKCHMTCRTCPDPPSGCPKPKYPECKLDCKNGGSVHEKYCTCNCVDGWAGNDCSQCPVCRNNWNNCDDNPIYCGWGDTWKKNCPMTCKTCPDPPPGCPKAKYT